MDNIENSSDSARLQKALLLSVLAYFAWIGFMRPPPPVQSVGEIPAVVEVQSTPIPSPEKASVSPTPSVVLPEHSISFSDDNVQYAVSSDGGGIREILLPGFTELPNINSWWGWIIGGMENGWIPYEGGVETLEILSQDGRLLMAGTGSPKLIPNSVRKTDNGDIVTTQDSGGVRIEKHIRSLNDPEKPYQFIVDVTLQNSSAETVDSIWFGIFDHMSGDAGRFLNGIRPQLNVDESIETIYDLSDLDQNPESYDESTSWFGIGSRYFLVAAKADGFSLARSEARRLDDGRYGSVVYLSQPLDSGATRELSFILYMGPKELGILESMGEDWAQAVEFGIFGFFSRILLFVLKIFYAGFNNWGVAILLLTLFVKLIFFPLTQKAFVSGRKMQLLAPVLKELKDKFKDDQQLQMKETMKLYKEHGTNPFSSCLPTLIQLPIWFALYNVMLYSVELYDSQFLYLKDLTSFDPYGILPVLYAILMLGQQQMMPMTNMDPMQQKMFKFMPIGFAAFMFTFPSGLVLYFSFNILLTIGQQYLIRLKFDEETVVLAPSSSK